MNSAAAFGVGVEEKVLLRATGLFHGTEGVAFLLPVKYDELGLAMIEMKQVEVRVAAAGVMKTALVDLDAIIFVEVLSLKMVVGRRRCSSRNSARVTESLGDDLHWQLNSAAVKCGGKLVFPALTFDQ